MHRQGLIFGFRDSREGGNPDCSTGFTPARECQATLMLSPDVAAACFFFAAIYGFSPTGDSLLGLRCTLMKGSDMKTIQIYDRPMCCSTGICGPSVDPVLPRFASDLDTIRKVGHSVERFNLAQQPQAFIENKEIHALISSKGTDVLPVVVIDGRVVSKGIYPSLEMLRMWTGSIAAPAATMSLPIADQGCCSGATGCC